MLTAAVESNAVTIKDIRAQLDAMRIDRDKEKTNAKESRVQNGVLRMRLAASTAGMTSSTDEVEQLRKSVKSLENTQLERAAEEVRKIAKLEGARDEAAAEAADLAKRLADTNADFSMKLAARDAKINELGEEVDFLNTTLEGEKAKHLKVQSENKETVRTLIIKETELRETRVKETLRETHRVEVNRMVEKHTAELKQQKEAHTLALEAAHKSRNAAEAAIAAEEERRRKDLEAAAASAAEMEKRAAELHDRIAELKALLAAEKEAREVERTQYDRTADSAAEALKALKAEVAQLNEQLESLEDDRRVDKIAADERVAKAQDIAAQEKKAMQEALKAERREREAENAKTAEEAKRLKSLVEAKELEVKKIEDDVENLKAEHESKALKVQSEVSSHTLVIKTVREERRQ